MDKLTFFSTREELRELTGLSGENHDIALWDAGFNLDDWDWGFVSDTEFDYGDVSEFEGYDGQMYEHGWRELRPNIPDYAEWLLNRMDQYCVGYGHTEYNGKHYYIVYHS